VHNRARLRDRAVARAMAPTSAFLAANTYLSHRTISTHLYRIFPKLGITAR
jgi:DNA-binding NarL/FixJ family response regulator